MPEPEYFSIELPSACKLYPGVDPSQVKIRAYIGAEEKIMSTITPANQEKKVIDILGRVLKGVDAKELTVGDRVHLLLWGVINSYSPMQRLRFNCEFCFLALDQEFDLTTMESKPLPDDFKEPHELALSTGEKVMLRLLRLKDEVMVEDYWNRLKESGSADNGALLHYRSALSVVGEKRNVKDIERWIESLPSRDSARIRTFQDKFYHGPSMEFPYTCSKCGGAGRVPVPFRHETFFPFGRGLIERFGETI